MIILTFIQILPFCFIAHSTHLCQPLDVVIFSMMQRSYGKLVLRTRKEGITITKAFFSKLLKEVRDEVLRPAVITGSFSTCGYFPFSFPLSYAFKQMLGLRTVPYYGYGRIFTKFPVTRTVKSFLKNRTVRYG